MGSKVSGACGCFAGREEHTMPAVTTYPGQLEPVTQTFVDALAAEDSPPIHTLSVPEARNVLEMLQSKPTEKPQAQVEDVTIAGGPSGQISLRIVRRSGATGMLPAIMYFHGGGWILGSKNTHDRLIRQIANETDAAVVFVNYTPSPEATYPVPIEEAYAATQHISTHGTDLNIDGSRLVVAGDSVGGNMAAAVAILAKQRGGPRIAYQALFYPVTDSGFDTPSYKQFASGLWLTELAMQWFWNAYAPDKESRTQVTASPLRASIDELTGLPPALVITDENDVLRDEGEAYAHKLMAAGVDVTAVRYLGTIHDFMMLNPLSGTPAAQAAVELATERLRTALLPKPEPRERGSI